MYNIEYKNLLLKSYEYFDAGKYGMFLDVFSKCYAFNTECFEDDLNVFRFSFATYVFCESSKLNDFNRFSLILEKYLQIYESSNEKKDFIYKIKNFINMKFDEILQGKSVIYYQYFNECTICLKQQFDFLELITKLNVIDCKDFIQEEVEDITKMINRLKKISRFTASRYIVHFPFIPNTPKKYFKEIEKKLENFKL